MNKIEKHNYRSLYNHIMCNYETLEFVSNHTYSLRKDYLFRRHIDLNKQHIRQLYINVLTSGNIFGKK